MVAVSWRAATAAYLLFRTKSWPAQPKVARATAFSPLALVASRDYPCVHLSRAAASYWRIPSRADDAASILGRIMLDAVMVLTFGPGQNYAYRIIVKDGASEHVVMENTGNVDHHVPATGFIDFSNALTSRVRLEIAGTSGVTVTPGNAALRALRAYKRSGLSATPAIVHGYPLSRRIRLTRSLVRGRSSFRPSPPAIIAYRTMARAWSWLRPRLYTYGWRRGLNVPHG